MLIITFAKALAKRWWASMSCAVFTLLGMYAAATNKSNSWMFWACCIAAAVFFFVASFGAWNEEHQARLKEQARRLEVEKRLADEEPKIVLGLFPTPDWTDLDSQTGFLLKLTNYGKRPAINVRVKPIRSKAGILMMHFEEKDVLPADSIYHPIAHGIIDGKGINSQGRRALWEFFHNCSAEQTTEVFDVLIRFVDLGEEKQASSKLQFDLNTKQLTIPRD